MGEVKDRWDTLRDIERDLLEWLFDHPRSRDVNAATAAITGVTKQNRERLDQSPVDVLMALRGLRAMGMVAGNRMEGWSCSEAGGLMVEAVRHEREQAQAQAEAEAAGH